MPDLILIPTPMEKNFARGVLENHLTDWKIQTVGFGLVAAAATTSRWIHQYQPERVLLLGIAGSYHEHRCPVATAARFDEVICDGIGVGTGSHFRSAGQMGWDQWHADSSGSRIGDSIALPVGPFADLPSAGGLLSVCAASENNDQAVQRRTRYPNAVVEDMEGFGVAVATTLASIPLQVVRGISNLAGDRDLANWKIEEALKAACDIAIQLAQRPW
ncbi:MAG: futalosine hydrolase [Rubripirellula sp.]|nr:futalosine hydrolase [Rubripirellula sp.]